MKIEHRSAGSNYLLVTEAEGKPFARVGEEDVGLMLQNGGKEYVVTFSKKEVLEMLFTLS